MARFKRHEADVDAYYYDGDLANLFEWIIDSFGNPPADNPIVYLDNAGVTHAITPAGAVTLATGAWLVRDSHGDWSVVQDEHFKDDYEVIVDATTTDAVEESTA